MAMCCFRSLRDKWQTLSDQLTDQQQQAKSSLFQLSTYEENLAQFCVWLQEAESKHKRDSELQPSLQTKKALLQNVKVSCSYFFKPRMLLFKCLSELQLSLQARKALLEHIKVSCNHLFKPRKLFLNISR